MKDNRLEKWFHRFASFCSIYSVFGPSGGNSPTINDVGISSSGTGKLTTGAVILLVRFTKLRELIGMPPSSGWVDWALLGVGIPLLGIGVAQLVNGWRHDRVDNKEIVNATHSPVALEMKTEVGQILSRQCEYALSFLVDRHIQNDEEMEQWEKEWGRWFEEDTRIQRRFLSPDDMAYIEEQDQLRGKWFPDFRYGAYNARHDRYRNAYRHYIATLQVIVDKYEKGLSGYPRLKK